MGFVVQSFYSLPEIVEAIIAVREVSDLPILASMVFGRGGKTFMGHGLEESYHKLLPLDISCFGHNCGEITPEDLAVLMEPLAKTAKIPLCACPNAGLPRMVQGKTFYDMTPEAFAVGMEAVYHSGVQLLGGCCGTRPEHIRAMVKRIFLL